MRTRREQVQAYRFVTRRIVSALLSGEPETNNLPMRRLGLAVFGSVMLAAIAFAGAGIYGLLTKGSAPLEENTLVIERETGAKYVFVQDRLYPVLNYTSARLVLDQPDPPVRTMSQASIRSRPRGGTIGIVDAPDALPEPAALLGLPWSVCNTPSTADPGRPITRLVIDQELRGGEPLGDEAILVMSGGNRYLLWNNLRMRVSGQQPAIAALGMAATRPVNVSQQLINAVPAGPNLFAPFVPGDGEQSDIRIAGRQSWIGQIFRAANQHYVLLRDGLAPVSEITARLLLVDGGNINDITPEQAGSFPSSARPDPEGFPPAVPALRPTRAAEATVCATYRPGRDGGPLTTTIEVFDRTPDELGSSAPGSIEVRQGERDAVRTAEGVVIPGGRGVVAQALPGVGDSGELAEGSTVYLITDQGIRYPLGTRAGDAKVALGYGEVTPLGVPASVLALIPTGPTLDSEAARRSFVPETRVDRADPTQDPDADSGSGGPSPGPSLDPSPDPSRDPETGQPGG